MNSFEQRILNIIDKYNMIPKGSMVVVGVSGGYDSLCLLNVLCNLRKLRKFDLCAVHINHSLREEADQDEAFVKKEAKRLGINAYTVKYNVGEYAEKNSISFETAGRILRYQFFNEVAQKFENSVIATAHNANDSAESMLMHLMRGCGLTGLIGIRPVSGNIVRPLIETDRNSIEEYCKSNGLVPREDVTNNSDDYFRNDIRHNVLEPILKRCSIESLTRTMNILADDNCFINNYATNEANKYIIIKEDKKVIPVKEFNKLPMSVKRQIVRIALEKTDGENQIGLVHIDEIIKMANKNYGGKFVELPGKRIVKLEKGELVL